MTTRKFTAEQIAAIIASPETHRALGQVYGVSRETIRQIRIGKIYRDALPDGYRPPPGPNDPSCERCMHWYHGECGLGFPDPALEGPVFASDCSLFGREGC
jgi:hypothetical protein